MGEPGSAVLAPPSLDLVIAGVCGPTDEVLETDTKGSPHMYRRQPTRLFGALACVLAFTGTAAAGPNPSPNAKGQQVATNSSPPTISGTTIEKSTLTGTTGSWSGGGISYAFQWFRCDTAGNGCLPIAGATTSSYLLALTDVGKTLRVIVEASNKNGTASAPSAPTAVIAPAPAAPPPAPTPTAIAPANTSPPTIAGTGVSGQTLTSSTGTWSGSPTSYAFQWQRCDGGGSNCVALIGASGSTYALTSVDVGTTLRTSVTATNATGSATATSPATAGITAPLIWTPPPTTSGAGTFGVATGGTLPYFNATDLASALDGYQVMGAGWARIDFHWVTMEPAKGTYDWSRWDAVVAAANARGIKILGVIGFTPGWARPSTCTGSDKCAPANPQDYGDFVKATVAHFATRGVHTWELWNEPNLGAFWKPAPNAVAYTAVLKAGYTGAKQADPGALVLNGGLGLYGAYWSTSTTTGVNPQKFLEQMYANGAHGYFDALAFHPYVLDNSLNTTSNRDSNGWVQMNGTNAELLGPSLRTLMAGNGDSAKQIWGTEFGEAVGYKSRTESDQAARLDQAMKAWPTIGAWAGKFFVYSYKPPLENLNGWTSDFGLVRPDWSHRPAWLTFQADAK
jgi:hypothetical protein